VLVWIAVLALTRYSSLAALLGAAAAAVMGAFVCKNVPSLAFVLAVSLLVVWRHRQNIARLLGGTEPKVAARKTAPVSSDAKANP